MLNLVQAEVFVRGANHMVAVREQTQVKTQTAHIRAQTDWQKVNYLVGNAMMSPLVRRQLLRGDIRLAKEFGISDFGWQHITSIKATTLDGFCGKLLKIQSKFMF